MTLHRWGDHYDARGSLADTEEAKGGGYLNLDILKVLDGVCSSQMLGRIVNRGLCRRMVRLGEL